jgi:uncharacterized protein YbjT (DUF2867 family)
MTTKILVTGATGTTGAELVRQLTAAGHVVRALVHGAEAAKKLPQRNVETVEGDYDDAASLAQAFEGIESIYALTPVHPKQVEWMRALIDAAKRAGVRRFVKHSAMTAGPDSPSALIRDHGESDDYLGHSGLTYTILQPNSFMQNLLFSAESIKTQGAFYQPVGDARQSVIDVADIAAAAVKTLTQEGHENKTYVLTGPESLTYHQIAEKIGRAIGKPVRYVPVSREAAEKSMTEMGMPAWLARTVVDFYGSVATGAYADMTGDVERVLGRRPTTFDQFIARHAAQFK